MSDTNQYLVSARKYRPATFRTVVGQPTLTATLKNAIASDRLAQAYLFCGPRGVGKTSCARIFAKTINCTNRTPEGEACGECESCKSIEKGNSFNLIELDAASNNGVDEIRNLTEQVNMPPQTGKYRVFIIDEVHMLSPSAFNAFLKTLEEPPEYVVFILATTEKHKVIPTILSRCQIYDFKRITIRDIVSHLQSVAAREGITAERSALEVIARKADGAMRDALSIFDQVAASSRGNITYASTIENLNVLDYDYYFRLIEAFRNSNPQDALLIYNEIRRKGFDSLFFINGLASHVRNLMMGATPQTASLIEAADDMATRYTEQARSLPLPWYYTAMRLLSECDLNYRTATDKQLLVELTLIRLSQLLKPVEPPFDRTDYLPPLGNPFQQSAQTVATNAPEQPAPKAYQTETPQAHGSSEPAPASANAPATPPSPAREEVQPQPPATEKASRRPRTTHRTSFSLSEAEASSAAAAADRNRVRRKEISDSDLQNAWREYPALHPENHILTSAMMSGVPVRKDAESFTFQVGHPAEVQAFELAMTPLIEYLRERLENDMLTISIEISEKESAQKRLTPHEFLKKVVSENPLIADMLKDLDAEMV